MFKYVNAHELKRIKLFVKLTSKFRIIELVFHNTIFYEFFTIATSLSQNPPHHRERSKIKFHVIPLLATNDFTSLDLNNLKLLNTMTFGHPCLDVNLLKANKNWICNTYHGPERP